MTLQIQRGKFYRTRSGEKVECICDNLKNLYSVVVITDGGHLRTHTEDGKLYFQEQDDLDLIAEWSDKPQVDWSVMPAGAKSVYWSPLHNTWRHSSAVPSPASGCWSMPRTAECGTIPSPYAPQPWSGDWKDSLVIRPGTEDGK